MRASPLLLLVMGFLTACSVALADQPSPPEPIKIGWIGPITGPQAKYGAYQAALLALEEVNAAGGVNGRPVEVIFEDGMGDGKTAANAAHKLIFQDHVRYILGGHCTPETMPIAPIAERAKVILFASITSNPYLSSAGEYIFRLTPISLDSAERLAPYVTKELKTRRVAVMYEESDYPRPVAERFAALLKMDGVEVPEEISLLPGDTDYRTVVTRIKASRPDGIYIGAQTPTTAALLAEEFHKQRVQAVLFGNEVFGNAARALPEKAKYLEGVYFAEPPLDRESALTARFIERFKERYNQPDLPHGLWTIEAYDALKVLTKTIGECGDDVERVKECLYKVKNYPGASGLVGINPQGDGIRQYVMKQVRNGQIVSLP